jgi:predicted nucleic acid-binding protein
MIYCDTSYLVRLYLDDAGFEQVRALCATDRVACSMHGRVETCAALHRGFRESRLSESHFHELMDQFSDECEDGAFVWFPSEDHFVLSLERDYRALARTAFLRAGDALHLACAREHGFREIHSNDKHLLAAARNFGLKGRNVIK